MNVLGDNFTIIEELALFDLYKYEIIQRLEAIYVDPDLYTYISELLPCDSVKQLKLKCDDGGSFAEMLYTLIVKSPMKGAVYRTLLNFLGNVDKEFHNLLLCMGEEERRSLFGKVLLHYEKLMIHLDVSIVLKHLTSISGYREVINYIKSSIEGTIPLFGEDSFLDLLQGIYNVSKEASEFVEQISPNFLKRYALLLENRRTANFFVQYINEDVAIDQAMREISSATNKAETTFAYNLKWDRLSKLKTGIERKLVESLELRLNKEKPLILREYQKELCEDALLGKNTIICAPTGSGKTPVATYIIKHYLNHNGNNGKVLFLTPNTMILQQQTDTLRKYLQHAFKVSCTSGSDQISLEAAIEDNNVVVTTPQMVVNLISGNNNNLDDLNLPRKPIYLCDFGMIVFDEVHGTRKNAPYSVIMQQYHRDKFASKLLPGKKLPQIIGLTASLGVGGAKNLRQALKHVVAMCGLLDCFSISMVKKHRSDLEKHSSFTADELIRSTSSSENQENFVQKVNEYMDVIEEDTLKLMGDSVTEYRGPTEFQSINDSMDNLCLVRSTSPGVLSKPPKDRGQIYEHWLSNATRTQIPESQNLSDTSKGKVLKKMEVLKELYACLQMASLFPTSRAYLEIACFFSVNLHNIDPHARELWTEHYCNKLQQYTSNKCALVDDLVEILCKQKLADFRAIIFIKTRRFASILSKLLNENFQLQARGIRSECITGLNSKTEDESTSKQKQADKIARFESGDTRCLIATSVAEEGLDIAACNLVVKYNYVTNEIAHVQRRGRGRAENSRCILLTADEKLRAQEEKNIQKEKLMDEVMELLNSEKFPLCPKVNQELEYIYRDIQKRDAERTQIKEKLASTGIVYNIECKTCSTFLCHSTEVKAHLSQYCACSNDIWKKVYYKFSKTPLKFEGIGLIFCRGKIGGTVCASPLGRISMIKNVAFPILTAEALKYTSASGSRTVRKWKKVQQDLFVPVAISNYDVLAMKNSIDAPNLKECEQIVFDIDRNSTVGSHLQ